MAFLINHSRVDHWSARTNRSHSKTEQGAEKPGLKTVASAAEAVTVGVKIEFE
tara:strand:- start:17 stop:175 length:159 start_codon:yes stop_codon:yes gene_type:complete